MHVNKDQKPNQMIVFVYLTAFVYINMAVHADIEQNNSIRGMILILREKFSCVRRVYVNINDQKHRIQDKDRQETI